MASLPGPASDPPGWPADTWEVVAPPSGVDADRLARAVGRLLTQPPDLGLTRAVAVAHGGRIVAEGYGPGTDATTPLVSWSMAKSITHALVGVLVGEGRLALDAPAPVPSWHGTPKQAITLQHLLAMRSGLRFVEDYVDAEVSHCIDMLFGAGRDDVAGYAAALALDHEPGTVWSYSSGTTNIVARVVGDAVGGDAAATEAWMTSVLFGPIGMASARPTFDAAGTFVGSSFVHATARDFLRFGLLYLRDGRWHDRRVLPAGWAAHAARPTPGVPDEEPFGYGAHWWLWRDVAGAFGAHGYEGQYTVVVPDRDLVVVRLGKTPAEDRPALVRVLAEVIEAFPPVASP